jgi:hypothetical protein
MKHVSEPTRQPRPRRKSSTIRLPAEHEHAPSAHPIGTPPGLRTNTGPMASAAWLAERELYPRDPRWSIAIAIGTSSDSPPVDFDPAATTRLQLEIYPEEWGFLFCHTGLISWIRITDVPFVHGRDEHALLKATPPLKRIGQLLYTLEHRHVIRFDRRAAAVHSTLADSESAIRTWVESL